MEVFYVIVKPARIGWDDIFSGIASLEVLIGERGLDGIAHNRASWEDQAKAREMIATLKTYVSEAKRQAKVALLPRVEKLRSDLVKINYLPADFIAHLMPEMETAIDEALALFDNREVVANPTPSEYSPKWELADVHSLFYKGFIQRKVEFMGGGEIQNMLRKTPMPSVR